VISHTCTGWPTGSSATKSVIRGLKRVVRDEMKSAGTNLSGGRNRDEAIHGARKSIKKVRAILRLVSAELGGAHERENARLRDVARRLPSFATYSPS